MAFVDLKKLRIDGYRLGCLFQLRLCLFLLVTDRLYGAISGSG